MDAIRKKMQSMKAETDDFYRRINNYETTSKEFDGISAKFDCDIRDFSKKVQKLEVAMDETLEKLTSSSSKLEEAEKEFKDKEQDVNTAARRVILLEEEARNSEQKLAACSIKVATMSKEADKIIREARVFETRTMNNEVEIETLDKDLREARRIEADSEMKYDNLARSLSMIEDELKRAEDRVKNADQRLVVINEDLSTIGENQKQLEVSEEKARRREEKYQDQIKNLNIRLSQAISRSEYAEMNISKLHHRIDEIEDEIIREKLKINAVSGHSTRPSTTCSTSTRTMMMTKNTESHIKFV